MTRGAIKERIAQLLNLTLGDYGYSSRFATDNAINRVTDEFAGPGMDCFWDSETYDIVSGTAEYCAPHFYKVKGAYWMGSDSQWRTLTPMTVTQMDRYRPSWRNDASTGDLDIVVFEGVNKFQLYPTPNFSQSGGGKFEGYLQTNATGVSTWAADLTECPLPSWCHEAIALGAAVDIAMTMLGSDTPGEAARAARLLPPIEKRYRQLRGKAERAAAEFYQSTVRPMLSSKWTGWSY